MVTALTFVETLPILRSTFPVTFSCDSVATLCRYSKKSDSQRPRPVNRIESIENLPNKSLLCRCLHRICTGNYSSNNHHDIALPMVFHDSPARPCLRKTHCFQQISPTFRRTLNVATETGTPCRWHFSLESHSSSDTNRYCFRWIFLQLLDSLVDWNPLDFDPEFCILLLIFELTWNLNGWIKYLIRQTQWVEPSKFLENSQTLVQR